jgi:high-affinity iron transporter
MHATHGDDGVRELAYLRSQPQVVMSSSELPLTRSARLLRERLAAYQRSQTQAAQDLAVSAYLDGFELVEASLDAVNKRLRGYLETTSMKDNSLCYILGKTKNRTTGGHAFSNS